MAALIGTAARAERLADPVMWSISRGHFENSALGDACLYLGGVLRAIAERGLTVALVCSGVALGAASSAGAAPALLAPVGKQGDVAATRAYLRASAVFAREASAELGARVAALEARASAIAGECPSVLTFAPRDEAFGELSGEVVIGVGYASAVPVRSLLLRESREIGHLRWSNARLTRLVRFQAAEERGVSTLALPDVCADIAAWKASAYAVLPKSVGAFLARSEAIEAELFVGSSEELRETVILRLLKPYESPAERRMATRVERVEKRAGDRVSSAVSAARVKLEGALGASVL